MTAEQYKTDALPVPEQGTASYRNIHQLFKKLPHGEEIHNIFPVTYTQSVYDGKTGANLEHILHQFNHIFLQFQGTPQATRNLLPKDMRRKGIMISYRDMDNNVVTETNINESESTSDNWGLDKYWAVYSISLDQIIKIIEDYIDQIFDDTLLEQVKEYIDQYFNDTAFEEIKNYIDEYLNDTWLDTIKEYLESLITEAVKLNPDDLDRNSDNQIQLADRDSTNGMGYVILRKNKTFAEQVTKENTIYEIRYDYDLGGGEVTIPANCTLKFNGGSLSNGTLNGNNTVISDSPQYNILNNTIIKGFNLSYLDIRWFGAVSDFISTDEPGTDNSIYIKRALEASVNCAGVPILIEGRYRIGTTIETGYDINLIGRYNNNRTFVTDSDTYTNKVSLLYVDNCSAFKIIGRGSSTTKATNITVKNLYLRGSGTSSNSIFIEYSATGGPARVGYIAEVEVRSFNKFLYFYDDGSNQNGTLYGNLTIEKVVAYYNNQFIVSEASGNLVPTLCNLIIKDSNIEQNGERAIDLENLFGASIIDNCILEGQPYPIKATITNGSLEITNNYFEVNEGDYLVNIFGKSANNCFVKYENNYKHRNVTSPLRFSGITLTGFDSMYNNPSQLSFADCIIACDIFQYLTTDSFTNTLTFNEPRYCNAINLNAIDSDENIRLLSFGNKRIESNILGTTVDSDRLYLVGKVTNLEVNEGDVLVIIFYKTYGNLQFGVYNSSGAPIASNNGIVLSGSSKMVMLKMNINASSSEVHVYMRALSGDPCIGNGMVYKNPNAVRLHELGIFPAGLLSNAVSPINAKASDIECNYFINSGRETKGLYYSDGTDIRNSDGAPFSKEEIVPDFIQYYSFLRANKTYKVVGDLDLNGTQVIVPEGCTVDFSRGGTISNGMFSLTNTRLLPQGLNLREYILEGVSITGTYKEGQIVYDSTIKKMKLWNGAEWVNLDGTALAEETI